MSRVRKHQLDGGTFGALTVVEHVAHGKWLCRCSCGTTTKVDAHALVNGHVRSCGCGVVKTRRAPPRTLGKGVHVVSLTCLDLRAWPSALFPRWPE